ncbi:hypothetical protein HAX54_036837, partial [Datura stramonium]|nr:hypothetical protein [Datura stramonium]
ETRERGPKNHPRCEEEKFAKVGLGYGWRGVPNTCVSEKNAPKVGVMTSKYNKEKEIEVARKGLKRLRKGTKGPSSSSAKGAPASMFGEREQWSLTNYHGSKHKMSSNILLRIGLVKDASHLSSPYLGQGP